MPHILIVDDEREICNLVSVLVRERGHSAQCVYSGEDAVRAVGERQPDLVLLDCHLEGIDGFETLRRMRRNAPGIPGIMLTAFGNVQSAVKAMKLGATDFISKPFNNQALLSNIEAVLSIPSEVRGESSALIGESPAFRKAMNLALKFAVPDINVLLLGETGTGKELFARAIHTASKRRKGPFVAVDCSMLPENLIESELFGHEKGAFTGATTARIGRLELAQGGTLFLDEIGNLPVEFQSKLLRVLQERCMERIGGRETIRLDVRVVSATNVNMKEAIRAGRFRQDLYYRLQEMTIHLPPLRERSGDIRRLAEHFVTVYGSRFGSSVRGISEAAMTLIECCPWPGNVRELENTVKSAIVMADDVILPEHLPAEICIFANTGVAASTVYERDADSGRLRLEIEVGIEAAEIDLKALASEATEKAERSLLEVLIRRGPMSGAQMAKMLRVDPKTLRMKLRRYGLETRLGAAG